MDAASRLSRINYHLNNANFTVATLGCGFSTYEAINNTQGQLNSIDSIRQIGHGTFELVYTSNYREAAAFAGAAIGFGLVAIATGRKI